MERHPSAGAQSRRPTPGRAPVSTPLLTGAQLRQLREAAGLRQAELARALDLPRGAVWAMEHGRRPVPSVHYDRILAVCTEAYAAQHRRQEARDVLLNAAGLGHLTTSSR